MKAIYYKRLGDCYWDMKDQENAILEYKSAVQVDPNDADNRKVFLDALTGVQDFKIVQEGEK